jgi:hypothetical protein
MNLMELILTESEIDLMPDISVFFDAGEYYIGVKSAAKAQITKLQPVFDAQEAEIAQKDITIAEMSKEWEQHSKQKDTEINGYKIYSKVLLEQIDEKAKQLDALKQENEGLRKDFNEARKLTDAYLKSRIENEGLKKFVSELIEAMHRYEIDLDVEAPLTHKMMMARAKEALIEQHQIKTDLNEYRANK